MTIPIKSLEYLAEDKNKKSWYVKMEVHADGFEMTMASDHIAPRAAGYQPRNISYKVVKQLPLELYEKELINEARYENMARGSLEPSYIEFELLLAYFTLGGSLSLGSFRVGVTQVSVAERTIGIASLLFNIYTGEISAPVDAVLGEGIKTLWAKSFRKLLNLENDWIIELTTWTTGQLVGVMSGSGDSKKKGPATQRLAKVQEFRRQLQLPLEKKKAEEIMRKLSQSASAAKSGRK